ncbi:MAG TPA: helix-turn-helix domain-containing protein [Thermoanaerobaculia bacterium]|jgi:transcriptional regulator with XRE-family HTH domain|nr:helix-turn-helix domain-containing protein [Thermoanaerobaculia bacterium]
MDRKQIERQLRQRIEAVAGRLSGPDLPDPGTVREVVEELDRCLAELGEATQVAPELASLVRLSVLQAAFPVLLGYRHGAPDLAWHLLTTEWERVVHTFVARGWNATEVREGGYYYGPLLSPLADPAADQELLVLFNLAVFEVLRGAEVQGRGRQAARRLMSRLSLSYDQLGRAFGVSGETVRRWERGSHPIPDERLADLAHAAAAVGRLEGMFRPDRLPQVVRRKAGLFGGEAALDWILRGRIGETADRYETALAYQG